MDIILENAKQLTKRYDVREYKELIDAVKDKLYDIDNQFDKIKFVKYVLEDNIAKYEKHKPVCKKPDTCQINFGHETISYYLTQELGRLGVQLNEDTFTEEEKEMAESKLDQILKDLKEVKAGQQVIYEDLLKEVEELKELYFLGKKKWYQLLIGKSVDMAASGVVSETISKGIIAQIKTLPTLLS